jgi:hypothetical protein
MALIRRTLLNQLEPRTAVVQAGAYAEHQFRSVTSDTKTRVAILVDTPHFQVESAPGCGARITAQMNRYVNQPPLQFPW